MALVGLGVTGGIGAYKAVEVARLLQKRGHDVHAVMTRNGPPVRRPADVRSHHARIRSSRASSRRASTPTSSTSRSRRASICCSSRRRRPTSSASSPTASPTISSRRCIWPRGARARRARDEHEHVGARRPCAANVERLAGPRRALRRSRRRLSGVRLGGQGAAWPSQRRSSRPSTRLLTRRRRSPDAVLVTAGPTSKTSIPFGSSAIDRAAGWALPSRARRAFAARA